LLGGVDWPIGSTQAVKDQLGYISEGDGVVAVDALVDELLDQVAEEQIDLLRGAEVLDAGEQIFGRGFGVAAGLELLGDVMRAKIGVGIGDEHTAAATFGVDVGAADQFGGGRREGARSRGGAWGYVRREFAGDGRLVSGKGVGES
jgi:hypothetical protein